MALAAMNLKKRQNRIWDCLKTTELIIKRQHVYSGPVGHPALQCVACEMSLRRGVGHGVDDRGGRALRARSSGPRKVSGASKGRGVRGDLEKMKFYKGEYPGRARGLRASTSGAV